MTQRDYKYKAFISYSHQDKKWGDWLHKALETYRVPKGLIGKETRAGVVPKRLFPIFRDREELPTSHELGKVIDQALRDSSHLVIICSPRSAKSLWVNEEIKQFKRLGKSDNILCLIVDGEPNAADKPGLEEEECFPEAAKYEIGEDGELSTIRTEPIAADAREGKDGKRNSLLKLAAGLLAVGFDDLKQRDLARKQKRMAIVSGVSMALVAIMAGLTFWALDQQQEAERQRVEAETQRAAAVQSQQEAEAQREAAIKARNNEAEQRKVAELENYFNNIALAQVKISEGQYNQAEDLLWAAPQALRNWEWGRLMHLCHQDLLTLKGGKGNWVEFSPYGRRVATVSRDKTVKTWDLESGKELNTLTGHEEHTAAVQFSSNGHRVLMLGFENKTAKIWDTETGQELLTLKGHENWIEGAVFSPDGRRVLTHSIDKTAKIWDSETGTELFTLKGVRFAVFSPDGRRVLISCGDGTAKIWDAKTGTHLHTLKGHASYVYSAVFSPDGRRVLTHSIDKTAKIWDAETGKELLTLKGHRDYIHFVAFSPDGKCVVTGSEDKTAKIWDPETGTELFTLKGHEDRIIFAVFSPDGRRVLTHSRDKTAKIWDPETGTELFTLKGHEDRIIFAVFSPDGRRVLTHSRDKTAKVWDAWAGEELQTLNGHEDRIIFALFSRDGRRVITGSDDGTVKIWSVEWGKKLPTLKRRAEKSDVFLEEVAILSRADNKEREKARRILSGHSEYFVQSAAFSPSETRMVTTMNDETAKIWDAEMGKELLTLKGHRDYIHSVAFSPDGQRVVTGSADKTAKIWDPETGTELFTLKGHEDRIIFTVFSPDGRRVITGSDDGTVKIWDPETGKELLTLEGHTESIPFAVFSPDRRRVITASYRSRLSAPDKTAKIWDAEVGRELLTMKLPKDISSLVFSTDGQRVLKGGIDQDMEIWDAVDWTLTKEEFYEQKRQRYAEWVKANVPKSADKGNNP